MGSLDGRDLDVEYEELAEMIVRLGAIVEQREEETLALCREIMQATFADSIGHIVLDVFLKTQETLSLIDIARRIGCGRRAVLPTGDIRTVVDSMAKVGILLNRGTEEKPRYVLDRRDRRTRILLRMHPLT